MNELFTFNSHQFQVLQPPPHKPTLRKRIVKTNDGSRYSTPLTSSTTSEENQHEQSRQSKENIPKRVSFCEIASPESHKIESNGVSSPASEEIQASSVRVSKTA